MKRVSALIGAVTLVALTAACGGDFCTDGAVGPECPPTGAESGWLSVVFNTPSTGDGGVLFTVSGARVDSIASSTYQVFWGGVPGESEDVIVAGRLADGPVARIHVPDVNQVAQYSITVKEVAASGTWEQRDPGSYQMTLVRD